MNPPVYLESSYISHLVGRISNDVKVAANQQLAREWWNFRRNEFRLFISDFVLDEIKEGDQTMAAERLALVKNVPLLATNEAVKDLGEKLTRGVPMPSNAPLDAFHIAVAAVNRMEYLLTLNLKHIANPVMARKVESICRAAGYTCPVLCTPQALSQGRIT
jgi:hypothetical protein